MTWVLKDKAVADNLRGNPSRGEVAVSEQAAVNFWSVNKHLLQ